MPPVLARLFSRRRTALIATTALVAAGLTTITALPAFAAVSCQVDYTLRSVWPTGFTADLTIRNTGDPISNWTVTFPFPGNQQISQPPWNAGTWSQTGNQVSISNAGWNGSIAAGGVVSGVGFNASYSGTNTNPTAFAINGVACGGPAPTPTLVVDPTSVNVPEGGTATYGVRLSSAPTGNLTVTSTAGTGDANLTIAGGGSLTFTPTNFATAQNVTLAAAEDADTTNGSRTFTVAAAGLTPVNVTATEADNDQPAQSLIVTPTAISVGENSSNTYSVRLATAPAANVTVSSTANAGGDANLTVAGGGSLTFTPANFATPQNVTIAAAEDADTTNGSRTFTVASSGLTSVTVTATEVDNDTTTQSLVVTPTAVTVPEQGTATYTVRLATAPTGNVTVTSTAATTGDTSLTVSSGASLTFTPTNFATPQTVTLAAADDADTTNGTRTFTVASSGLTPVTVTATEADNDTPPTQSLVVTPTTVTVPETGTATYAVRLSTQPTGNVTVTSTAGTGDADITVSGGGSLTFTTVNWNVTQNVTLAAANDADTTNGSRTITVASTGLTSVSVAATEVDDDGTGQNAYITEFLTQYNKIKATGSGYFSPEGVPYHSVETFMIEAPDHGHETTSEAYSFYVWLEAMYGRVTGDWTRFNAAWANLEQFIIPTQQTLNYNPASPATYAPEFDQPSQYPSPLNSGVTAGQDPLYSELQSTYGNAAMYSMHWLLDVDNVYGYGAAMAANSACNDSTVRVAYINTYQRGPQESVWETVAHPSCETFTSGGPNGFLPLFIQDSAYAQQWRYTDAPDADARAIEAAYWALTWATAQGAQAQVQATVAKAAKMGDYLRYAFYDKYFKQPGCTSPTCAAGTGKNSSNYLLSWYFAWGGGIGASWSWRIGSSHNHGGYQNPLAAWALSTAGPAAIRPQSATAAADWSTSLTRQLQFMTWLQSAEGGIAGGATNSWQGAYATPPSNLPKFYGMTYDFQPVYHDPPSNQWFGFQAWGMSRVAEYYNVTGDAMAKAILDKWVAWAIANTTLGANGAYQIPSTLAWTGAPAASYSGTGTIAANTGLHVSIVDFTNDVGVSAALARTLTAYAARAGATTGLGLQAKDTAKGLLDRLLLKKDAIGISVPETRNDYNRLDDVWSSSNQQGLYIPPAFTGTMANGDVIQAGKSFLDVRSFLKNDPAWPTVQSYLNGGAAPVFNYHRFWAQSDFALALADYGFYFPAG